MSHEQPRNPEQKNSRWEMDYTWGDMLVAVLERKVIDADDPNYPAGHLRLSDVTRYFRATNGDKVIAWGGPSPDTHNSMWKVGVTPAAVEGKPARAPYGFWISDLSGIGLDGYQVADFDNPDMPISPAAAEALLGMVVTMVPVSETTYRSYEPNQ